MTIFTSKNRMQVYDDKAHHYERLAWVNDKAWLCLLCDSIPQEAIKLIDLGCGPALMGPIWGKLRNKPYIGVDASKEMVSIALRNIRNTPKAYIYKHNILHGLPKINSTEAHLLFKNVLHLLPISELSRLGLPGLFPGVSGVTIVETVSPNEQCLNWVAGLYAILKKTYKRNWFTQKSLLAATESLGAITVSCSQHAQWLVIRDWFNSLDLDDDSIRNAFAYISTAPQQIRNDMQIEFENGTASRMLRLQAVVHATFKKT